VSGQSVTYVLDRSLLFPHVVVLTFAPSFDQQAVPVSRRCRYKRIEQRPKGLSNAPTKIDSHDSGDHKRGP